MDYLFDPNANSEKVKAYANVGGLFQVDPDTGYYFFNSNSNYAEYHNGSMVLYEHTYTQRTQKGQNVEPSSKPIGFFPFHEYDSENHLSPNHDQVLNHHFGMSMDVKFALTENKLNKGNHITYEFSGDDDLWVFVDGKLALDIGGIHQPVRGYIDFTDGTVYVYGVNESKPKAVSLISDLTTGEEHTLKMFYLERGGCDSNLSVKFNFPLVLGKGDLTVYKAEEKEDGSQEVTPLKDAVFGLWQNAQCTGEPMRTFTTGTNGHIEFDDLPITEEGQTFYLKEITAPNNYYRNDEIYTVTAGPRPTNGEKFQLTVTDKNGNPLDQQSGYPVVYNKPARPITLSMKKVWRGGAPENATATFKLKRYRSYEGDAQVQSTAQPVQFNVYRYKVNNNPVQEGSTYTFMGGTDVTVNWSYSNGYYGNNYSGIMNYKETKPSNDGDWGNSKNGNNPVTIHLPNSGTANLYIRDENVGTQWGAGVTGVSVNGTPYRQTTTTQHLSATNEPDDDYNDANDPTRIKTLDASTGWEWTFPAQPAMSLRPDGLIETYTYYIEEIGSTNATDFAVGYDRMDGNKIAGSDTSEERVITNFKNEVFVKKRWLDAYGNVVTGDDRPTTPVSVTLRSTNGGTISGEPTKDIIAGTPGVWNVANDATKVYEATENITFDGFTTTYTFKDVGDAEERTSGGVHRGGTIYVNNQPAPLDKQVVVHKKWIHFRDAGGQIYCGQLDGDNLADEMKLFKIELQLYYDLVKVSDGTKVLEKQKGTENVLTAWEPTPSHPFPTQEIENIIVPGGEKLHFNHIGVWEWGFRENTGSGQEGGAGNLPAYGYHEGELVQYNYYFEEVRVLDGTKNWDNPADVTDKWWKLYNQETETDIRTNVENRPTDLPVRKVWKDAGGNPITDEAALNALPPVKVYLYATVTMEETPYTWVYRELELNPGNHFATRFEELEYAVDNLDITTIGGEPATVTGKVAFKLVEEADYRYDRVKYSLGTTDTPGEREAVLENKLNEFGALKLEKIWPEGDAGNKAVLVKLDMVKSDGTAMTDASGAQVDLMEDIVANPTRYGLTADDVDVTNKAILIRKVDDEWPQVTVNLPKKMENNRENLAAEVDCRYVMTEIGYVKADDTVVASVPETWEVAYSGVNTETKTVEEKTVYLGKAEGNSVLRVSNTVPDMPIDLIVKKVDRTNLEDDEAPLLPGAAFKLVKYADNTYATPDNEWVAQEKSDTENTGTFRFTELKPGYYKIEETRYPAGYVKVLDDPCFQVRLNETTRQPEIILMVLQEGQYVPAENNKTDMARVPEVSNESAGNAGNDAAQAPANVNDVPSEDEESDTEEVPGETNDGQAEASGAEASQLATELALVVGNEQGARLPNTGGPGTAMYTILGTLLILGAAMLLARKQWNQY